MRNHLIVSIRNLRRHKVHSLVSIAGLAVGMTCCLLIILFVRSEMGYDGFHQQASDIYRVASDRRVGDQETLTAMSPPGLAQAILEVLPEAENATRLWRDRSGPMTVRFEDRAFPEERLVFADSNFFSIFSFPLLRGNPEAALREPFSIVITESTARKYFGDEDPIGKVLIVREPSDRDLFEYRITGVAADLPTKSHIQFDFLASFVTQSMSGSQNLLEGGVYTYVLLHSDAEVDAVSRKLGGSIGSLVSPQMEQDLGLPYDGFIASGGRYDFIFQPIERIHLYSGVRDELGPTGDVRYVYLFSAIAAIVLLLACANFVNVATALATERAHEVGVRKTVGARRGTLIRQFLFESTLVSLIAAVVAIAIAGGALPRLSAMTGRDLAAVVPPILPAVVLVTGFALLVGVAAGFYPAFILSSAPPVTALKSGLSRGAGTFRVRNALILVQLVVSILLVAGTTMVSRQLRFVQEKRFGFETERVLVLTGAEVMGRRIEAFKQLVLSLPGVLHVTNSERIPGRAFTSALFRVDETSDLVALDYTYAGAGFAETFGLDLKEGRTLFHGVAGDSLGVLLNETAVERLALPDPIGKRLIWPNESVYTITGVVRDFHVSSMREEIPPVALLGPDPRNTNRPNLLVSARVASENLPLTIAALEKAWRGFAPHQPFVYRFVDDEFEALYRQERLLAELFTAFAAIALLLASIGLLGLTGITARMRSAEIGVRRVLGATVGDVVALLSRDYLKLVLAAIVLAIPIAYLGIRWWLEGFAYHANASPAVFLGPGGLVLLIAMLTVGFQAVSAALKDPVKSLRHE